MANVSLEDYLLHAGYTLNRRTTSYVATKRIIGRGDDPYGTKKNPYGNYKNPYYDPVKRHEYYEAHKDPGTKSRGSGGSGGGKGSGGSGGGKGGKGGKAKVSDQIAKLREESNLNTEAQREATKNKIADLKAQLTEQLNSMRSKRSDEEGFNKAEMRGKIQALRSQIGTSNAELSKWITNEKETLNKKIASLQGKKYDSNEIKSKQDAKNKEVSRRAETIYKRQTKK